MLLVVGWAEQAGLRAWLSRGQVVPLATPDESAYLIAARVLVNGGVPANFSYSTLYPAGYPLLITPVFWFTRDPVTAYRAVLMINALLSALVLPLGFAAGRRMGLDRPLAYAVAMVAAVLPAGLFYAEYAMTDAIYPVIVLGWLLAVHGWLVSPSRRGRYAAAVGSALLAGYADAVHSRGLVILAVYLRGRGRSRVALGRLAGQFVARAAGPGAAARRRFGAERQAGRGDVPERRAQPGRRGTDPAAQRARPGAGLRAGGRADVAVRAGRLGGRGDRVYRVAVCLCSSGTAPRPRCGSWRRSG